MLFPVQDGDALRIHTAPEQRLGNAISSELTPLGVGAHGHRPTARLWEIKAQNLTHRSLLGFNEGKSTPLTTAMSSSSSLLPDPLPPISLLTQGYVMGSGAPGGCSELATEPETQYPTRDPKEHRPQQLMETHQHSPVYPKGTQKQPPAGFTP